MASSYKEVFNKISEASKTSKRYSKGDHVEMTQALLNEGSYEVEYFTNPSNDEAVKITKDPVKDYRDSLKPLLSEFGVDKAEQEKINSVPFSKKHAEALINVSQLVQHDYLATGKKIKLPQFNGDEACTTLELCTLPEKVEETKKIENKQVVPTGKTIKTAERTVVKSRNKVPSWLKSEV